MNWPMFWSAASAVAAIGVLVVTAVYVWLTHRLAKAAESQIWEASRARILVSVGTNQGGQLFLLEFLNVGNAPAEDLEVAINHPIHQQLGQKKPITDAPFFKDGVRSFPPQHPVKFALGVSFRWLDEKADRSIHPVKFDVEVRYRTFGRLIKDKFPINIENQYSFSAMEKDYVEEFSRNFPDKFVSSIRDLNRTIRDAAEPNPTLQRKRSWPEWFSEHVWKKNRWN
jgi:hypothetical protein